MLDSLPIVYWYSRQRVLAVPERTMNPQQPTKLSRPLLTTGLSSNNRWARDYLPGEKAKRLFPESSYERQSADHATSVRAS